MAAEDQLAALLERNSALFTTYEGWANAQTMLLAGTLDDPNSFNAEGGKSGALGYYPVINVSGQTIFVPCLARMQAIAAGSADPAALETLLSAQVSAATAQAGVATTKATEAAAQAGLAAAAKNDAQAAAASLAGSVDKVAALDADKALWGRRRCKIGNIGTGVIDQGGVFQTLRRDNGEERNLLDTELAKTNVSGLNARGLRLDQVGGQWVRSGRICKVGNGASITVDLTGNLVTVHRDTDGALYQADGGVMARPSDGGGSGTILYGPPSGYWNRLSGWFVEDDDNLLTIIIKVGQSWDWGQSKDAGDATITTAAQHPGWALMFDVGTNPDGAPVNDFVDLREQATASSWETPLSGIADSIMSLTQAAVGRKPRCLFFIAAEGGTAYYGSQTNPDGGMKRGSKRYMDWTYYLDRARAIAASKGWRPYRVIFHSNHGHEDTKIGTTKAKYQQYLEQYAADARKDVAEILGPDIDVRFFCGQVNRMYQDFRMPSDVALAQLDAPDGWLCDGSYYDGPESADKGHVKALGWRMNGLRSGYYIAHAVWGVPREPLRLERAYMGSSSVVRLQFNRLLTKDESDTIVAATNLETGRGIAFFDGAEVANPVPSVSISAISVVSVPSRIPEPDGSYVSRADTVSITLSGAPTGREPRVVIAGWSPTNGSGATGGPRSGFRSTTPLLTDGLTGVTLYDWACHEVRLIPYRR
ncbi:hypothetical protein N6H05_10795 [Sphingobium sp. WTD-1]|uniref:hypothetical protein n=1 Tax=Sphingobium sp. WTD-1 TaxID=2979467 RepID=UPI0024DE8E2F|nr:hypothetical protein [Sphingobium sp. WTD-1]WIA58253.1 hypothetical protein N6H05_10795 [Sphingobium sp. WTD-1]